MQIISLGPDGKTTVIEPQSFDSESKLQKLIAQYPSLLFNAARDGEGMIWTIGTEVSTDSGSVDLLALDSSGTVCVIETKLRKNPEINKQVVGQILAYASSIAAWPLERLEATALGYLNAQGHPAPSLVEFVANQLGTDDPLDDAAAIVEQIEDRLRRGQLTAAIVVDELTPSLRRVVEFINDHADFELLAVQIQVVESGDTQLVIPTVAGVTAAKAAARSSVHGPDYQALLDSSSDDFKEVAHRLMELAKTRGWIPTLSPTKKSLKLSLPAGPAVVTLYPQPDWELIEFPLKNLEDTHAAALKSELEAIIGQKVTPKQPTVKASAALANWPMLEQWIDGFTQHLQEMATSTGGTHPG